MKKITLLSLSILFSLMTMAQSTFQLGFRATPNVSWLKPDADNVDSDGTIIGFNYGVIADFNISERYSFSTGVESITTGGKLDLKDVVTKAEYQIKYVEVPLTLKLKTNQIGYMTYYGQFGVGAGINYEAVAEYSTMGIDTKDKNYGDHLSIFRGSIIMGLGAEYNISGNTSIVGGITFNNGVTNIFNKKGKKQLKDINPAADELKAISNFMGLNIGIIF